MGAKFAGVGMKERKGRLVFWLLGFACGAIAFLALGAVPALTDFDTNMFGIIGSTMSIRAVPTNAAPSNISTTDFALNVYYTNSNQRAWISTTVTLTNVLATDVALVSLYLDHGDGTFELTGRSGRLQGLALLSGTRQLSAVLQPNARFLFTNRTVGLATAVIDNNSSEWVRQ